MIPRCPNCTSTDIRLTHLTPDAPWACDACGTGFRPGEALVPVGGVQAAFSPSGQDQFVLDPNPARGGPRDGADGVPVVNPSSDADELHDLVVAALEEKIIRPRRPGAYLRIVPSSIERPEPFLIVEPGDEAPALSAGDLYIEPDDDRDPLEFTLRFLGLVVARANDVCSRAILTRPIFGDLLRWLIADEPGRAAIRVRLGRRYNLLALPLNPDGTTGRPLGSASALSIMDGLLDVGEQLESRDLDPALVGINVFVDWNAERGR
jgi:hypothetical protein